MSGVSGVTRLALPLVSALVVLPRAPLLRVAAAALLALAARAFGSRKRVRVRVVVPAGATRVAAGAWVGARIARAAVSAVVRMRVL